MVKSLRTSQYYSEWLAESRVQSLKSANSQILCLLMHTVIIEPVNVCISEVPLPPLWLLAFHGLKYQMVVNHRQIFQSYFYIHAGYLNSLGLTALSTICHLPAKTNCKCICQCCLANCERERKDLDTGCVGQQVLVCQLCWLCQVINLGGTAWHAAPRICRSIALALRLCKNMVCWAATRWR